MPKALKTMHNEDSSTDYLLFLMISHVQWREWICRHYSFISLRDLLAEPTASQLLRGFQPDIL